MLITVVKTKFSLQLDNSNELKKYAMQLYKRIPKTGQNYTYTDTKNPNLVKKTPLATLHVCMFFYICAT